MSDHVYSVFMVNTKETLSIHRISRWIVPSCKFTVCMEFLRPTNLGSSDIATEAWAYRGTGGNMSEDGVPTSASFADQY
jgi:hypothetical protein